MDERARRIGENEALFRTVNDEVQGLNERFAVAADPLSIVCECGSAECAERLDLSAPEYEAVRENPRHFAVTPGHEAPDVERVVERHGGYSVVEKLEGEPAELARQTDTRN